MQMTTRKATRNYFDVGWMGDEVKLATNVQVLRCAKCGAKLRRTNIDPYCNLVGLPLCDPHGLAYERSKILSRPMKKPPAPLPTKTSGTQGSAGRQRNLELDRLSLEWATKVSGLTISDLTTLTAQCRHSVRSRLKRLFDTGLLLRQREVRGTGWGYRYSISEKGLMFLAEAEA